MHLSSINSITNFLFYETSKIPKKIDLVLILGNDFEQTSNHAYDLIKGIKYEKILITGGNYIKDKKESDLFKETLIEIGIKEKDILIENKATNTKENIIFSKQLLSEEKFNFKYKKVLVICKSFHTRRVLMTLNNFFYKDIKIYFHPIQDWYIDKFNWFRNEKSKKRIFEELIRIWEYSLKKDLY